LREFLRTETGSALVLATATVAALVWANISVSSYDKFWGTRLAVLIGERRTAALYRFYSVRDEFPALYPVAQGGQPVLGELYDVPMGPLSALLATEPPELELSIIELEGGDLSFGMVLRDAEHARGLHKDITSYGGWRAYRAAELSEEPDPRRP
ncbi:MAG TPA: Na+/H+ antiporter NhaA, partial [Streptosporangiaceae bacterium]|nr:Na+/H+ antiporter NhaA [Streptosporangiaceae bacterium]